MSASTAPTPQTSTLSEPPKRRYSGDRGNVYKREKLIGGRTAKEMGLRKIKKSVDYWTATCDHKNKRGRKDCLKKFGGFNPQIVMGNKALHEQWHEAQDRRAAELG